MLAPCGHAAAQCIIGNYWQCAVCDAKPAAFKSPIHEMMKATYPFTIRFNGGPLIETHRSKDDPSILYYIRHVT